MTDKKRVRIGSNDSQPNKVEEPVLVLNAEVEDTKVYYKEDGEFNWDAYEATCPSRTRKPNPHIKTRNGDKVYSRESYAQDLYDLMEGHEKMTNVISNVKTGEIVDGKIFGISSEWMTVDVDYRELIYVKLSKEPRSVLENYTVGDAVSVLITEHADNHLTVGSISGGMKQRVFRDLQSGIESEDTAWVGRVEAAIENGGYIVHIQGVDCFMPGSLAGINKLYDFNSIIGTDMYVVPVSFSPERGTIVVSHRKYLQALIPNEIENLKTTIEEEKTGTVTGTAKYGVFVEFNSCLTGMIHANDLDEETMNLFKSRSIKPGDPIKFWIKDIISNSKITLSQKAETINNPWKDIEKRFKVPCNVEAKVKTKKDYGLFISVEDGLVGLLHVSELDEAVMDLYNPGDTITVQINRIDKDSQKIFLKLPA